MQNSTMMDESTMDSSYGPSPPDEAPVAKDPAESVDEQNAGAAQILIAKEKLPSGTKEGDTFTFKVSKDVGDEYILDYVNEGQQETNEPTRDNLDATTDKELSALDTQGDQ
jgi:hypothetical protein